MRHGGGPQRALPVAADASHGAVGEARLYTHTAAVALHEAAAVQI